MKIIIRGPKNSGKSMLGTLIVTILDTLGVKAVFHKEDRKLKGVGDLLRAMRHGKPAIEIFTEVE